MKKYFSLVILFSLLYSCEKSESEQEVADSNIKVTALYVASFQNYKEEIDIDSKVFIYYGIESYDILKMTYLKDGLILYKTDTIKPVSVDTIGALGYVLIDPDFTEDYVSIGVESKYYSRFGLDPFILKKERPIILTVTNKP